jgi:hypothetical protein
MEQFLIIIGYFCMAMCGGYMFIVSGRDKYSV